MFASGTISLHATDVPFRQFFPRSDRYRTKALGKDAMGGMERWSNLHDKAKSGFGKSHLSRQMSSFWRCSSVLDEWSRFPTNESNPPALRYLPHP